MKNIHILPTDKPSRLVKQKYDTIDRLCLADMATKRAEYKKFNIYITSNEEIKEGDCVYHTQMFNHIGFTGIARVGKQRVNQEFEITSLDGQHTYYSCKEPKVVLTTDQELIKDGVQTIDDEFLEWFVKNPSCEMVEVLTDSYTMQQIFELKLRPDIFKYKIIIPKEEICSFCDGTGQVVSSTTISRFKTCDCKLIPKEEPIPCAECLDSTTFDCGFHKDSNQDKLTYSEEEVFILLAKMADTIFRVPERFTNSREWFNKFKK